MLTDFDTLKEIANTSLNGGICAVTARILPFYRRKVIATVIYAGAGTGLRRHEAGADINYVVSGTGRAVCDGAEEILSPGTCHICPVGSGHSIENTGSDDLVLFTAVCEI
jgi:mannose-6-phosphate isomerase-like protein (cupin superfamily)